MGLLLAKIALTMQTQQRDQSEHERSTSGERAPGRMLIWTEALKFLGVSKPRILCVLQNCLDAGGFPDPCGRYRLLSMGEEDPDSPSESDNYDY